jgi:hypothetical protein
MLGAMRKHRRKLLVSLVAAGVVGLVAFAGWLWHLGLRARINQVAFEHIRVGMTQAEVEAILGAPPGDYTTTHDVARSAGTVLSAEKMRRLFDVDSPCRAEDWWTDEVFIQVYFLPDGTVAAKEFAEYDPTKRPVLSRIQDWLERLGR